MGQKQTLTPRGPVPFEKISESIKIIFNDLETKYTSTQIVEPIELILRNLSENIPAQKTSQGFLLNHKMIEIFYHKNFVFSMGKLINMLMDKLEEIGQRSLIMIKRDEWNFCLNLVNFIIFFTDDKLIRMIETISIRSDLSQSTHDFIKNLEKQGLEFSATHSLIDKLSFSEIQRIEKSLRISMNLMISMRAQVITRSQTTLQIIQKLEYACFILYLKALYNPEHSKSILAKAKHPQFLKSNLTIAHYFLGKGCDMALASIYESAVLFLFNLIENNRPNLKQYKCLPTHFFKNLPVVSQNSIYDFAMNVSLFNLIYNKQNGALYSRFSCNRIMTLKLLDLIVKELKVTSPQITYSLEEVCLQTKIGMIERSFVTDLVQNYLNLVQQTIDNSNKSALKPDSESKSKIEVNPSFGFSKQHSISQILTAYLKAGQQNYNIKYSNKKWKITTVDVVTKLENDQNIIQTQFKTLCEKYIYEIVLGMKVIYEHNEKQIWSEILPNIIEDMRSNSDEDIEHTHDGASVKLDQSPVRKQDSENIEKASGNSMKTPIIQSSPSKNQEVQPNVTYIQPQTVQIRDSKSFQTPIFKLQKDSQISSQDRNSENFQTQENHEKDSEIGKSQQMKQSDLNEKS